MSLISLETTTVMIKKMETMRSVSYKMTILDKKTKMTDVTNAKNPQTRS